MAESVWSYWHRIIPRAWSAADFTRPATIVKTLLFAIIPPVYEAYNHAANESATSALRLIGLTVGAYMVVSLLSFFWHLLRVPAVMHGEAVEQVERERSARKMADEETARSVAKKDEEIRVLRDSLDDRKPHLEAHIDAVNVGLTGDAEGPSIMAFVSVYNTGAPTILRTWDMAIEYNGTEFHPRLTEVDQITVPVEDSKPPAVVRYGIEDYIHRKSAATPIPTGGMVQGFILAQITEEESALFRSLRGMAGITYTISFKDVLSNSHEATMTTRGQRDPIRSFPQIKRDVRLTE